MKIISLILCFAIILTSCTKEEQPNFTNPAPQLRTPLQNNYTLYTYPYNRPDISETEDKIKSCLQLIVISEQDSEALSNTLKVIDEINKLESLKNIALSRVMTSSESLPQKAEVLFMLKNKPFTEIIKYNIFSAVNSSPHKEYILANLTETEKANLSRYKYLLPLNRDQSIDFNSAETALKNLAFDKNKYFLNAYENFLTNKETPNLNPDLLKDSSDLFLKIQNYKQKKAEKSDINNQMEIYFKNSSYNISEVKMLIKYTKDFIIPLYNEYEKHFSELPDTDSSEKDLLISASDISPLAYDMLTLCKEKNTLHIDKKDFSLPFPLFITELSAPFICFSPTSPMEKTILNKIIGESLYQSCCGGITDFTLNKICGFSYDVMAKEEISADKNIYRLIKETLFFSFLTELYFEINSKPELSWKEYENIFSKLISEYYPNNKNEDSLMFLSSIILSFADSPMDLLIASHVSMELTFIKFQNSAFAKEVYSSLIISGKVSDLKEFLRSIGFQSPFNANTIRQNTEFYRSLLEDTITFTAAPTKENNN